MSTTIDERVVEMRFDNEHFEKNVKTSMSTLDKLKQKLNLTGAAKGLENVGSAAKNVNMTPLTGAVDTVRVKFSALEVMAITALTNITNSAVNAGKRIVSALTIDPIKSGFSEYETQINAVQTILANTESKGKTLEDVNSALDELNLYADKTIYNFTEMTRNIGTFTAAGVDLDTSVAAIKGIANLAAVSGSTSQQASTAMYQLSQALASGTVKLMDWNSVVNAGMGGQVFQDALKETARVHGIAIDSMIESEGSFRETLSQGWLTSEILTETLSKFTGDLTEAQLKTMGYNEEQIAGIIKMGKTANDAATKVKTFTQLFDTLKEAAQSGWTQTWEILVGDFGEAKELFTEISDVFGAMIGKSAESRNTLLEGAMGSKWSQLEKKVTSTGIAFDDFQERLKETAKSHGISIDDMIKKEGSLEKTLKNGWLTSGIIAETLRSYTTGINKATDATSEMIDGVSAAERGLEQFGDVVDKVINGDFGNGEDRIKALTDAGYDYVVIQDLVNYVLSKSTDGLDELSDAQLKNLGYTEEQIAAIKDLAEQAEKTGTPLNDLIAAMEKPSGRELLIDTFRNILTSIGRIIGAVKKAWTNMFPPMTSNQLYNIVAMLHSFSERLVMTEGSADKLRRTFEGVLAIVKIFTTFTGGALKVALKLLCQVLGLVDVDILDITASVGDALVRFKEWLFGTNIIARAFNKLGEGLRNGAKKIAEWFNAFKSLPWVQKTIEKVKNSFTYGLKNFNPLLKKGVDLIKKFGKSIVNGAKKVKAWIDHFMALPKVQVTIQKFKSACSGVFSSLGPAFKGSIEAIKEFVAKLKSLDKITWDDVKNALVTLKNKFVENFKVIGGKFGDIKVAISSFRDNITSSFSQAGNSIGKFSKKVLNFLKPITDFISKNVGFGEIFTVIFGIGIVKTTKKIGDALEVLGKPISGLSDALSGLRTVFKSVDSVLKAKKLEIQASALLKLAIAIAVLAGTAAILSLLDQGKLWSSVGAIAVLAVVLVGLSAAISAINKTLASGAKTTTSLLVIASAILILVIALKQLDGLDSDKILRNVAVLITIMGALVGFSIVLAKFAPKLSAGALSLIGFALATRVLVGALKAICEFNDSNIGKAVGVLLVAMAGLALVAAACKKVKIGAALTIFAISIALKILINSFDDIAELDTGKMLSNMGAFITIFGMFAVLMVASKLAGKNAAKAGIGILTMSIALILIVSLVKQLAKIDQSTLTGSLATMSVLMALFAGVIAVSALAGKNAIKAGVMLLMMAGALAILSVLVIVLSKLDPDGLQRAVEALVALELCFALLIGITKLANNCVGTLTVLTATIAILAVAIGALSMINADNLKTATIALATVIGMFTLLVASTAIAKKASLTLILMTGIVAVLAGILYVLADLPVESTLSSAASLSVLLLALSASCLILAGVGTSATQALMGIGVLAALIVAVGALMVAIGALVTYCPQVEAFLDKALPVLSKVGYGIGSFIGSIVGGLASGVMSGLPAIAESLSEFMTKLQPFLDGAKTIDEKLVSGIASIVEIVLMLTAADIINGMTSWLTGGSSISDFASQLLIFGAGIAAFSATVKGKVDEEAVTTAANAGKILTELAKTVPNSGGLVGFFAGENDIGAFAEQLPKLGKALVAFSSTVKDSVDEKAVEIAVNAGKMLTELAKTVPNSGGLIGFFMGENDIGAFAEQLPKLGRGLVSFSTTVRDQVDKESVEIAVNAGKMLTELAKTVPNSGGLIGFFMGENDIGAFAEQLPMLGVGLVAFSGIVKGKVDAKSVEIAANAGKILIDLAKTVPNSGGLIGFFAGENDIDTFASKLPMLGVGLVAFSGIVKDKVDATAVATATFAGTMLTKLAAQISQTKTGGLLSFVTGGNIETFGDQLPVLGAGIAGFSKTVDGKVNAKAVAIATQAGAILVNLDKSIPSSNAVIDFFCGKSDKMKKFKEQMPILGEAIVAFSNEVTGKVNADDVVASTNAGLLISELAAKLTRTDKLIDFINGNGFTKFADQLPNLGTSVATFSHNVRNKVSSTSVEIAANAASIIVKLAENISGSKTGAFSNFIANDGFTTFANQLPNLGTCIASFSNNVKDKVDSAAVEKAAHAGKILANLAEHISASKTGGILRLLGDTSNPVEDFANQLPKLGVGIADFSKAVSSDAICSDSVEKAVNASKILADLSTRLSTSKTGGLMRFLGNTSNPVEAFAEQLPKLAKGVVAFSNEVDDGAIDSTAVKTASAATTMLTTLVNGIPTLGGFWTWIAGESGKIQKFKEQMPILGQGVAAFSNAVSGKIDKDDVEAAGNVSKILIDLTSNINEQLAEDVAKYCTVLPYLGEAITNYYGTVSTVDTPKFETAIARANALVDMAKGMVELDPSGMAGFGSALGTMGKKGLTDFINVFSNSTEKVKEAAVKMLSDFINGVLEKLDDLKTNFKLVAKTAANAVRSKYDDYKDAGKYLTKGLAVGIIANQSEAINAAENMASAALSAAKKVFGINSPSKEFYEIGRFSVLGFTNALDDYGDKSYDAGADLAKSAKTGLRDAISRVTDIINGDVDTQPTIRPVLDLTNVESGTRRLNTLFSRSQAMTISADMNQESGEIQNGANSNSGNVYQFTQNNYSPKALSRVEIYRQTKNQFSAMERMVEA